MISTYAIKKQQRWLKQFGVSGAWSLRRSRRNPSAEFVHLRSRKFGPLLLRNRIEDFEAVNTVLCFGAYQLEAQPCRFGSVLDLGANIGVATRYFLSVLPGVPVLAIEPCRENCELLQHNVALAGQGGQVRVWQAAVGPVDGIGHFRNEIDATRFDSLQVAYCDATSPDRGIPIHSMQHAIRSVDPPVLVKMDIEGGENGLLECRAEWIGCAGRMMIEFHDPNQERYWVTTLGSEKWRTQKQFDTWHFWRAADRN